MSAVAWLSGLLLNSMVLGITAMLSSSVLAALVALVAANAVVSVGRFLAVRGAAFRAHIEAGPTRP